MKIIFPFLGVLTPDVSFIFANAPRKQQTMQTMLAKKKRGKIGASLLLTRAIAVNWNIISFDIRVSYTKMKAICTFCHLSSQAREISEKQYYLGPRKLKATFFLFYSCLTLQMYDALFWQ